LRLSASGIIVNIKRVRKGAAIFLNFSINKDFDDIFERKTFQKILIETIKNRSSLFLKGGVYGLIILYSRSTLKTELVNIHIDYDSTGT